MLEWLATIGAVEVGKAVFEQGLKLTQAAAEELREGFLQGLFEGRTGAGQTGSDEESVCQWGLSMILCQDGNQVGIRSSKYYY
jgi:hypothetical protein